MNTIRKIGKAKAVLTLALLVALCAAPLQAAFADRDISEGVVVNSPSPGVDADVSLTKVMGVANAGVSINVPYTFSFEASLTEVVDDSTALLDTKFDPIRSVATTITIPSGLTHTAYSTKLFAGKSIIGNSFPHAGEYVYSVKETGVSPIPSGNYSIVNSQAEYTMRVYVKNYAGGRYIASITVDRIKGDDGAALTDPKKIDPTPNKLNTFSFTNIYNVVTNLKVKNLTVGSYADLTKEFDYTLTLTKASTDAATSYTVRKYSSDSTLLSTETITPGTAYNFSLAHGEFILIEGIGTGATYTVTDAGSTNYTPSVAVNAGNVAQTVVTDPVTPGAGDSLRVVSADVTYALGSEANAATFTNTYQEITPTGVVLDNLPFIMLIAAGVGGIVLFGIGRKRRRER